ncbi:MAG: CCA tRNA nucleotidyltransferase [Promethearchaeota archaeon]
MLVKDRFPIEIIDVCQLLTNHGFQAFIVGGSIRDAILEEINPQDWDIATDAKPPEVIMLFEKKFRVIPTGIKHGTVTILYNNLSIEITTFRVEREYFDGRRPSDVHFVGNIVEDLSRRDLTINAIAYDPINNILSDPFEGIKDIEAKILRMVGDPHERLREDGLRLIRIFRFVAQLGFNIEVKTLKAVPQHFDVFSKVAKERIHTEFQKLLQGTYFQKAIQLLGECGFLFHLIPEFNHEEFSKKIQGSNLNRTELTLRIVSKLTKDSPLRLRFAVLIHQISNIPTKSTKLFPPFQENFVREFLKRMKCSNKQITEVSHILSIHLLRLPYSIEDQEDVKNYIIRKFQHKIKPDYLSDYLMFYHAKEAALEKERRLSRKLWIDIMERARIHQPINLTDLAINGEDIIQYFQINKKIASEREFIGICLEIIRERVEIKPHINQKRNLIPILENLNKIISQCVTRITRQVRVVSTDHIRKLYRGGFPEYVSWENEHTYILAKWLILCILRKDQSSIVFFDGTNFNMPTHPNHRESLGNRFRKYRPLYINTNATKDEAKLNSQVRDEEKSSIKKSDADLSIFQRYQDLFQTYPKALSTSREFELIQVSTRDPDFNKRVQEIANKIRQNRHRLIIMSGNVLTGKTYTAYALQKQLENLNAVNV